MGLNSTCGKGLYLLDSENEKEWTHIMALSLYWVTLGGKSTLMCNDGDWEMTVFNSMMGFRAPKNYYSKTTGSYSSFFMRK